MVATSTVNRRRGGKRGSHEGSIERRAKALEMRKSGMTYRAIGAALGVSQCMAHKDVHHVIDILAREARETAEAIREIELERLDAMLAALWPAVEAGDTSSISTALRVAERRARLLGLDAPVKQEVTGANGGPLSFIEAAKQFADAARARGDQST
jgi:hypothetical protein